MEFALLAPVLLLLLFGTVRAGHAIGVQHALSQLAASAARYSLPADSAEHRESMARAYVRDHAGSFPLLDAERVDLRVEQAPESLSVFVSMDVSNIPSVPILSAAYRFPSIQVASASIAVQQ